MKILEKKLVGQNPNGKNVLIIGGVHGNELTPIYTLSFMLRNDLFNLKNVKSITILNGLNSSGLKSDSREMIKTNTSDLNRMLVNEPEQDSLEILKNNIENNDVIIDIHSSPSCTEFALIDIDEYTESMSDWCDKSNVTTAFRYSGGNTVKRYCLEQNKPALTLEVNKMSGIDFESAKVCIEMINDLLENSNFEIVKSEPLVEPMIPIQTYKSGILISGTENGDLVKKGEEVCSIHDLELNETLSIKSPEDGIIITTPVNAFVNRGDSLYLLQPTIPKIWEASADVFRVNIVADSLKMAKDIIYKESYDFPVVKEGGELYVNMGQSGEMSESGKIKIEFKEIRNRGILK